MKLEEILKNKGGINSFKHVNESDIPSYYPSIETLMKEHPNKTIEEYLEIQQQYVYDALKSVNDYRSDLVNNKYFNEDTVIYTKRKFADSPEVTYFFKYYNFYLDKDSYRINYKEDIIEIKLGNLFKIELKTGLETYEYRWKSIATSNINQNTFIIEQKEYEAMVNIVNNAQNSIKLIT